MTVTTTCLRRTLAYLAERYPNVFPSDPKQVRPLAVGIHTALAVAEEGTLCETRIRHALRYYCGNMAYLAAVVRGARRIGLDGQEGERPTPEEQQQARDRLSEIRKALKERKATAKQKGSPERAASPKPAPRKSAIDCTRPGVASRGKAVAVRVKRRVHVPSGLQTP
ncbi:ProQ/FINO family protein [Methylococcus mesophilus]|uniref:ProQ/FINO family protein n=1 Tax=Methylococcus mesophilus TaxID=2993564 RepID=UPI00224A97F5|nr:ProQ/FINO family protein [Methylococcus mesophilus]UZR30641.1 ProQ/FINO family protein [Methylococcus mesophilus]